MLAPIHPIPNRGSWIRPCSVTDLRRFKEQFNGKRSRYSPHTCVVIFVTKPHTLQTTYWDSFQKPGDQFEIFNINLSRNFISDVTN